MDGWPHHDCGREPTERAADSSGSSREARDMGPSDRSRTLTRHGAELRPWLTGLSSTVAVAPDSEVTPYKEKEVTLSGRREQGSRPLGRTSICKYTATPSAVKQAPGYAC